MTYSLFLIKLNAASAAFSLKHFPIILIIILLFFSRFPIIHAQESLIKLKESYEFPVENNNITGFESHSLQYCIKDDSLLYVPKGFKHSTLKFIIAEYNLINNNLRYFSFTFPSREKIDTRVQNGALILDERDALYVVFDEKISHLNFEVCNMEKPKKLRNFYTNYIPYDKKIYSFVNYSYSNNQDYAIGSTTFQKPRKEKRINLTDQESDFFNFGKTNLWTINNNIIYHINVARPTITCFDSDLNTISKQTLTSACWTTLTDINEESRLDSIVAGNDKFTRAISYLEYGLSKTLDIAFVEENLCQVIFATGMSGYAAIYFKVDQLGNLVSVSDCYKIPKSEILMNNNWITHGKNIYKVDLLTPESNDTKYFKLKFTKYSIQVPNI